MLIAVPDDQPAIGLAVRRRGVWDRLGQRTDAVRGGIPRCLSSFVAYRRNGGLNAPFAGTFFSYCGFL